MRQEIRDKIDRIKHGAVPDGYKRGTHHIIPNTWEDLTFAELVSFEGGSQPPKNEFISYPKEGYVRLIQIRDYKTDDYATYIPIEKARKFCEEDDVMIGRYGPPIFQILRGIKGAYNVALMKAVPNESKLSKEYLYYYIQNETLFILIDRLSRRTSGQTGIDIDALNMFPFPIPEKNEQQNILKIIRTWDKAIELKEQLIEQKKEQKRGLMHKLLNGEVRLPGFTEDWKEVKLSEVARQSTLKNDKNQNLRVLSCTKYDGLVDSLEYFGRKMYSDDISKYKVVKRGQICYATNHIEEGSIGILDKFDFGLASPMYTIFEVNNNCDSNYIFQVLKSETYVNLYKSLMSASVNRRGSLRWNEFSKIKIMCPPKEEQEAIARFIDLVNHHIDLLEQELEALKLQKRGLMQLLLTGIVRVPN